MGFARAQPILRAEMRLLRESVLSSSRSHHRASKKTAAVVYPIDRSNSSQPFTAKKTVVSEILTGARGLLNHVNALAT
jgi:hypothetical protein